MSLTLPANSADWSLDSDMSLGLEHTDNLFFTSSDAFNGDVSDTTLLFVPAFNVLAESETSKTELTFGVSLERYDKVKEADRNDPFVRLNWESVKETFQLGLGLGYLETSTRTSELETTGQVNIFGTQSRSTLEPFFLSNLNDSNSLKVGLNLQVVDYDLENFFDYNDSGLSVTWLHDYSEVSNINISMDFRHYDSEQANRDFDYGSIFAGFASRSSESLSYYLNLGMGYGVRENDDSYTTGLLDSGLVLEQEYYTIILALSSSLVPTGQADLRQVYALTFGYDHRVSENTVFNFNARISESFPVDDPDSVRNELLSLQPSISYRMAEKWYLDVRYQYRSNRNIGSDAIVANTGYIGIRWLTK